MQFAIDVDDCISCIGDRRRRSMSDVPADAASAVEPARWIAACGMHTYGQRIAHHVGHVTLLPASTGGTRGRDPLKKGILRHGCGLMDGEGDSETVCHGANEKPGGTRKEQERAASSKELLRAKLMSTKQPREPLAAHTQPFALHRIRKAN